MQTCGDLGRLLGYCSVFAALSIFPSVILAMPVSFGIQAPHADTVSLQGSFPAGWGHVYALHPAKDGTWRIQLDLPPGRYEYAYRVDGVWRVDPRKPAVPDGFGRANNLLTVPGGR